MPDQIPAPLKAERAHELAALEAKLAQRYFENLRGRRLQVLIEGQRSDGQFVGTSCRYATVVAPAHAQQVGRFSDIIAGDVADGCIHAEDC
jgi:tRNA A37 methylthiotransferase MiaB